MWAARRAWNAATSALTGSTNDGDATNQNAGGQNVAAAPVAGEESGGMPEVLPSADSDTFEYELIVDTEGSSETVSLPDAPAEHAASDGSHASIQPSQDPPATGTLPQPREGENPGIGAQAQSSRVIASPELAGAVAAAVAADITALRPPTPTPLTAPPTPLTAVTPTSAPETAQPTEVASQSTVSDAWRPPTPPPLPKTANMRSDSESPPPTPRKPSPAEKTDPTTATTTASRRRSNLTITIPARSAALVTQNSTPNQAEPPAPAAARVEPVTTAAVLPAAALPPTASRTPPPPYSALEAQSSAAEVEAQFPIIDSSTIEAHQSPMAKKPEPQQQTVVSATSTALAESAADGSATAAVAPALTPAVADHRDGLESHNTRPATPLALSFDGSTSPASTPGSSGTTTPTSYESYSGSSTPTGQRSLSSSLDHAPPELPKLTDAELEKLSNRLQAAKRRKARSQNVAQLLKYAVLGTAVAATAALTFGRTQQRS